ncbi:MAG: HDOD domain-containing protein [FCB group bacterium]|nr:HDOD domain-containing protein [FCB group bacterium]
MSEIQASDERTVDKLLEQLGDLPSAPIILSQALQLTSDLQSSISDLTRSLSADQSLSAKVIRISNSPFYARLQRVASLDEAIRILGFKQLKSIIITATTYQMFENCAHAKVATDLWHHSLSTAIGSRMIAQKYGQVDKEESYLAGLLHDIGKLALLKLTPNVYEEIIEIVKMTKVSFIDAEDKELGFNHTDVGKSLLVNWEFPTQIITAVAEHHTSNLKQRSPTLQSSQIISLADSISRFNGASFYEPYSNDLEGSVYLGSSELPIDDLISLRCEIESGFNAELDRIFN